MAAEAATAFYEAPDHTTHVSIDDVEVKKQKLSGRAPGTPAKEGLRLRMKNLRSMGGT